MVGPDFDYYSRRARQERAHAESTEDAIARRVHQEMADRYAELLESMAPVPVAETPRVEA